ncbi:MAG: ABC transporter ATP-binding protein [Bilifractor sp.]|jgi:ABC-2 type transport system ATP-binding protein
MRLSFEEVSYYYDKNRALDSVTFHTDSGEIVGLIGENGAGKSTTIKIAVRYLVPAEGRVRLDDKDISDIKLDQYPVSYIPDSPVFYEELSLLEHLQFTKAMFPDNKILIDEVINQFELREHIHKIPSALSKGTRQKLMIAMAIMRTYDVLIADEPFSGLDPRQISVLKKLLIQQKENGKSVLLSSHLLDVVENICDRYDWSVDCSYLFCGRIISQYGVLNGRRTDFRKIQMVYSFADRILESHISDVCRFTCSCCKNQFSDHSLCI